MTNASQALKAIIDRAFELRGDGHFDSAIAALQEARELLERTPALDDRESRLTSVLACLAQFCREAGRLQDAETACEHVLATVESSRVAAAARLHAFQEWFALLRQTRRLAELRDAISQHGAAMRRFVDQGVRSAQLSFIPSDWCCPPGLTQSCITAT